MAIVLREVEDWRVVWLAGDEGLFAGDGFVGGKCENGRGFVALD